MNHDGPAGRSRVARPSLARLPPLTALRTFVAVARHGSFAAAAGELHVTSAAVGQQVRLLEDHLGQPLFLRNRGQLELTATGRQLLPGLSEAFASLMEAVGALADTRERVTVRLSVAPSFAAKWLMPRLARLTRAVPRIEVQIEATSQLADLEGAETDGAIRYGAGSYPGFAADMLFTEAIAPICSPEFAERFDLVRGKSAVLDVPLIHEHGPERDRSGSDWNEWLAGEDLPKRTETGGVRLNLSSLVIDAALAGQGLALGKLRLCESDLTAGRLVMPFGLPRPTALAYSFVTAPHKSRLPEIELIRNWLRGEALSLPSLDRFLSEREGVLPLPATAG